jgi:hypothetical protein
MGNQGYSNPVARECAEIIWSGEIGNVSCLQEGRADANGNGAVLAGGEVRCGAGDD